MAANATDPKVTGQDGTDRQDRQDRRKAAQERRFEKYPLAKAWYDQAHEMMRDRLRRAGLGHHQSDISAILNTTSQALNDALSAVLTEDERRERDPAEVKGVIYELLLEGNRASQEAKNDPALFGQLVAEARESSEFDRAEEEAELSATADRMVKERFGPGASARVIVGGDVVAALDRVRAELAAKAVAAAAEAAGGPTVN